MFTRSQAGRRAQSSLRSVKEACVRTSFPGSPRHLAFDNIDTHRGLGISSNSPGAVLGLKESFTICEKRVLLCDRVLVRKSSFLPKPTDKPEWGRTIILFTKQKPFLLSSFLNESEKGGYHRRCKCLFSTCRVVRIDSGYLYHWNCHAICQIS